MAALDLSRAAWRKSSRSQAENANCVECAVVPELAGAAWRRSSRSAPRNADCVELAPVRSRVAVRDSKDPHGPALGFPRTRWAAFASAIKADRI